MTKTDYLKKYFKFYYIFFINDLKYSLLIGRDFKIIYTFLILLCESILPDTVSDKEKDEKIKDFENNILKPFLNFNQLIIENNNSIYNDQLNDIINDNIDIDNIDINKVKEFVKNDSIRTLLGYFLKSYRTWNDWSNALINKQMLVEVNNFLSHFLIWLLSNNEKQNFIRGTSHLYRGALDGYKTIITNNPIIIGLNKNLLLKFIEVRKIEGKAIGEKDISYKKKILDKYIDIVNSILTIKNITQDNNNSK